ncbi:hypothetical protein R3P38DRAFT_3560576, partial [Favolaschia claudopus]
RQEQVRARCRPALLTASRTAFRIAATPLDHFISRYILTRHLTLPSFLRYYLRVSYIPLPPRRHSYLPLPLSSLCFVTSTPPPRLYSPPLRIVLYIFFIYLASSPIPHVHAPFLPMRVCPYPHLASLLSFRHSHPHSHLSTYQLRTYNVLTYLHVCPSSNPRHYPLLSHVTSLLARSSTSPTHRLPSSPPLSPGLRHPRRCDTDCLMPLPSLFAGHIFDMLVTVSAAFTHPECHPHSLPRLTPPCRFDASPPPSPSTSPPSTRRPRASSRSRGLAAASVTARCRRVPRGTKRRCE